MFRSEENGPTGAQFATRVAVLSAFALIAFGVIFFRLWYLEVLSAENYREQSQDNRIRETAIPAPRGEILDASGKVLVGNRSALALQIDVDKLPARFGERKAELQELSDRSGISYRKIKREIREQQKILPYSPVTLARDVDRQLIYYLRERSDQFPGVTVEEVTVRRYPGGRGRDAAVSLGYPSEITESELDQPRYQALELGDEVGRGGLEGQYDDVLRGVNGATRQQFDANGVPRGKPLAEKAPVPGDNLVLTLRSNVQRAGEQALASGGGGNPGAFVAMNVHDGSILGMGSYPTFDPDVFIPPVSTSRYAALHDDPAAPLQNRASAGEYAPGSTFKPFTALAALKQGKLTTSTTIYDDGEYELGPYEDPKTNAGGAAYGALQLQRALQVSSDIFFYTLGDPSQGYTKDDEIQQMATELGLGSQTGIDLADDAVGDIPTPAERNKQYRAAKQPDSPCGTEIVFDPARDCFERYNRPWYPGDSMNLAVGQGDVLVDPLQMAVAYAAIANGGKIVRPHLASRVEDPLGVVVEQITPDPSRQVDLDPAAVQTILAGLHDAAMEPTGTSYAVFGGYPVQVAGKTGTAEVQGKQDQSWYLLLAPYPDPKVVIAVTVEEGGFGSDTAAPIARDIANVVLGVKPKQISEVSGGKAAYE